MRQAVPPQLETPTSPRTKYVVAHHMVGNTFPYTLQDWTDDIFLAHASGIDGFALNIGRDEWQPDRVTDAYQAALQSGLAFKMFLSLDMSSLPCASTSDAQSLRSLVLKFSSHPNQLVYSKPASNSGNPLPLVSTFAGETCTFGLDTPANAWRSQFTENDELKDKITFVPSFFIDPGSFKDFEGVMDGDFHWNGGWPVELTTASAGSSSTSLSSDLTNLLGLGTGVVQQISSNVIPHLSTLLGNSKSKVANPSTASQSDTDSSVAESIASALAKFIGSTEGDLQHVQGLNTISASSRRKRDNDGNGSKIYMAAVSPWFFTHFGADTFNKNFFYVADQHLYAKRWESLISASADAQQQALSADSGTNDTSSIFNDVDIVEIISWNDYGESHYVGPIKGAQPTGSEQWTNGMGHEAWLPLTAYYATAFKTGSFPNITKEDEKLFMWSRPHPAQATASQDGVGNVLGSELAEDSVWAITLLAEPANITFEVYQMDQMPDANASATNNSNSSAPVTDSDPDPDAQSQVQVVASQTFSVPAGLSKLSVPISVPDSVQQQGGVGVSVRGRVVRSSSPSSGSEVEEASLSTPSLELDAGKEGFVFVKNPEKFNFNAWVGCAGCASLNNTTTAATPAESAAEIA
ncbi:hypothetical protein VKT23_003722 [Stygiomarasmius scandens]